MLKDQRGSFECALRLSHEDWRSFFRTDVVQVAGRASRLLRLVELLEGSSTSPTTLKVVMGVIGRDTVGHSRDIQTLFRDLLGIECLGCRDAIERISTGMPLSRVIGSVRLKIGESEWLNLVKVLDRLLCESLKRAGIMELSESYVDYLAGKDYTTLVGNPLKIFSILRGFYAASRRILPLYSPNAFFVQALRAAPRFCVEKLVGEEHIEVARAFNIAVEELVPCADSAYSLVSLTPGSTGDMLASAIDVVYRLHDLGMPHGSKHLRIRDELREYVARAYPAVSFMAKVLGVERELNRVSKVLLSEGDVVGRYRGFKLAKLRVKTGKPAKSVIVGGRELSVEVFMRGMSPYLVLGLGRLENLKSDESNIAFDLTVYMKSG